jgi:uncharacterized protein YukJ
MLQEDNYGVLKCRIIETIGVKGKTPHFHIHGYADGLHFRASINIKSEASPFEMLYYIDQNFQKDLTSKLSALPFGFNAIGENIKEEFGLDYLRGNLFELDKLEPIPDTMPGPENDLEEKIRAITHTALQNQQNTILYIYGKRWGPEGTKDKYFHFTPGDGIDFIHMNQGNSGDHAKANATWQDGGLLVHFEPENKWIGIFLAFQSQRNAITEDIS